ncbi:MAG: hypothetical protein GC168_02655 [Candidatus Hydrogenedens sp.]|nr:hypothetical protein [Candidatus Hydrogenedens sp.]
MLERWRRDVVRNFVLSAWGLLTLVLLFAVMLLLNEMVKNGQDPLDSLRAASAPETQAQRKTARPATALGEREIQLYFAEDQGRWLVPQPAVIEFSDSTVENCRTVIDLLIKGPNGGAGAPVMPPGVRTRALYLLDNGELVVDFSREMLTELGRRKSASIEAIMFNAICHTVAQRALQTRGEAAVRRVRFLIEGSAPGGNFPAHIDLREPLEPDAAWVGPAESAPDA